MSDEGSELQGESTFGKMRQYHLRLIRQSKPYSVIAPCACDMETTSTIEITQVRLLSTEMLLRHRNETDGVQTVPRTGLEWNDLGSKLEYSDALLRVSGKDVELSCL